MQSLDRVVAVVLGCHTNDNSRLRTTLMKVLADMVAVDSGLMNQPVSVVVCNAATLCRVCVERSQASGLQHQASHPARSLLTISTH